MTRLLIMGPPGSGKGTQAVRIADKYRVEPEDLGRILVTAGNGERIPLSLLTATLEDMQLSWPRARGATSYEVFRSSRKNMSGATRVKTTSSPYATITGMTPGKTYCWMKSVERR